MTIEDNGVAETYLQLNRAEQAATRMERMLDTIEDKMQQLIKLQEEMDSDTNKTITNISIQEFKKLDDELRELQNEVEQLQTDPTD